MALTSYTCKDASGATHTFATQIVGGLETAGTWSRAVPLGGGTPYKNLNVSATGSLVKNSPGSLYAIVLSNNDDAGSPPVGEADIWVKFYDKATAPTVGTDVPVWTVKVPASQTIVISLPTALAFLLGIGIAATLFPGDTDATAIPASAIIANLNIG